MKTNKVLAYIALLSSSILSACGGGGGDSPAAAGLEGAYSGTFSNGLEFDTIVLEDGQYYTLYGTSTSEGFALSGFMQGTGQSNNGSFSSANLRDYFFNGTVASGTLSASYSTSSLNGTVTEGANTTSFTGAPTDAALFNYNTPASPSTVIGAWDMTSPQNQTVSMTIGADGAFSAASGTCAITGTITPRPSGKNIYNVNQTFGAACPLAGQSASGIAVVNQATDGQRALIVLETTTSRANGVLLFGAPH